MGKKGKKLPTIEEVLQRPWCYYCERDFDDLKILLSHQKAKHFKCTKCGRRLNTAGGLAVHMNQVHKENLSNVDNALPNRQGLDVEIFGMEGVPEDISEQHRMRVLQNYYEAQAQHTRATGNPPKGSGQKHVAKKPKLEGFDTLRSRLDAWKISRSGGPPDGDRAMGASPFNAQPASYPFGQPQPPSTQHFSPAGVTPFQPPPYYNAGASPGAGLGLPPRPPAAADSALAASVDDLIADAKAQKSEKKPKKREAQRLVYSDNEVSPEERMAQLAQYRYAA